MEPSLDSMFFVCTIDSPLSLTWRTDSTVRLMFVFTDEVPQTYVTSQNPILHQAQDVIDACVSTSTLSFIWSQHQSLFEPIAVGAGGKHFELTDDWAIMFQQMNYFR